MPALEVSDLQQRAVLWPALSNSQTGVYSNFIVGPPKPIRCRWQWTKRQVMDSKSQSITIDAEVVVAQPIPEGSILWLGDYRSLKPGVRVPPDGSTICEVKSEQVVPDVKARVVRRTLSLMKKCTIESGQGLPQIQGTIT